MFPVSTSGSAPPTDSLITLADGTLWAVPEETPVAFVFNRRNYAIMMATPDDLADFTIGFSLSERIIDHVDDIERMTIQYSQRGIDLAITINTRCQERLDIRQRRRNLPGSAGCGICGLENADELFTPLRPVAEERLMLEPDSVRRAMAALSDLQPINARTRSVHAAAWVDLSGEITQVREDVGRHNALDKLLGALALSGTDMSAGFLLMSSRCSYELIQKAAQRGVRAMASLSAPTLFALRKANEAHMTIYARTADGVSEIRI